MAKKKGKSKLLIQKRNKKVAQRRGEKWLSSLGKGHFEAKFNPSKLRLYRVKKGVPQRTIAKALGMSVPNYGGIEAAHRRITEKNARLVARKLGVELKKVFKLVTKKGSKVPKFVAIKGAA